MGATIDINAPPIQAAVEPAAVGHVIVGGVDVARLDLEQTAQLMIALALASTPRGRPYFFTSANGEVLARRHFDHEFAGLIDSADLVSADGQPLVLASRLLSQQALPERVATTDLFPAVARLAEAAGVSFYLFGGEEDANRAAFEAVRRAWPSLDIRGRSHGHLSEEALEQKVAEIDALAPNILWVSLGVPLEQEFARRYGPRLKHVKIIKTSGGLLDFIGGVRRRAPLWMQQVGLEWAFRVGLEPRRLFWRYFTSNPVAMFLLLTQTS